MMVKKHFQEHAAEVTGTTAMPTVLSAIIWVLLWTTETWAVRDAESLRMALSELCSSELQYE